MKFILPVCTWVCGNRRSAPRAPKERSSSGGIPAGDVELTAYRALLNRVISPPIVRARKSGHPYWLEKGASANMAGVAAFQTDESGQRHPIGFWSRSLLPAEKNYSASKRESLPVVWALTTSPTYLQSSRSIVYTDQASLRWLLEIAEPSRSIMLWRLRLSEFSFEVRFKKGNVDIQADALSRLAILGETVVPVNEEIP